MKQQEIRITEDISLILPEEDLRLASESEEPQPVQASADDAGSPGTAIFVVAPCRSLDEGRSMSVDEHTSQAVLEWIESFRKMTGLRGPDLSLYRFVAGDGQWMLWRKEGMFGTWRSYMLYLLHETAVKRVWSFGWCTVQKRISYDRDGCLLRDHYPQMAEWVNQVAMHGSSRVPPVPSVKVVSRKEWFRQKRGIDSKEYILQRRAKQRERYQRIRAEMLEKQRSEELPAGMGEVALVALQKLWEAKTPLSIRRQAPRGRFAPAVLAESLGLPEKQIEVWIKRQIAEGRIAEEMCCRKMRRRGLKTL